MTTHEKHPVWQRRRFDVSLLTDAIDYELGPRAIALGGEIWLEGVVAGRLVVCCAHRHGDGEGLRRWLHASLLELFDGDETAFELWAG